MQKKIMALALILLATGCATQEQTASVECGAAGIGIGFLACKLAGGSDATCAAVGGAAGLGAGVLCYNLSAHLDKERQQLAGHENDLDARIKYTKNVNAETAAYNDQLKKQIDATTQHTDALTQQIRQNTVDAQALSKERARQDKMHKDANDQLAAQRKALNYQHDLQAQYPFKDQTLTTELQRQQKLYAQTQSQIDALAAQRQRI